MTDIVTPGTSETVLDYRFYIQICVAVVCLLWPVYFCYTVD